MSNPRDLKMIDEIIDEIESLPDSKAATKFSERFAKTQLSLVEFIFATLDECSSEAQEAGFFIALVVWAYYSRTSELKPVGEKAVVKKFNQVANEMQAFEDGDDEAIARLLPDDIQKDEVLSFVTTEIEGARREGDITMDEAGTLFVTLRVVVDCLAVAGKARSSVE
jgi:hypothetical protein